MQLYEKLFLIKRDGTDKYNNQNDSMSTAVFLFDNMLAGITSKESFWDINTARECHQGRLKQTPAASGTEERVEVPA